MSSTSHHSKSVTLYLLSFAGLADVVELEIKKKSIQGQIIDKRSLRDHDLLVWYGQLSEVSYFKELRSVEDIFWSVQNQPFHLAKISQFKNEFQIPSNLFRQAVFQAIEWNNRFFGKKSHKKSVSYISFVKQDIDHGPGRKAVADILNYNFALTFQNWKCQDPADIECWGFWSRNDLFVGIRITPSNFRTRTYRKEERKASLRPTIAAAMAILSNPSQIDKVIDPMCGSGTLVIERGLLTSSTFLEGYDIDSDAVELAIANVTNTRLKNVNFNFGNATALPLKDQSINCILCNMPFGKIYGKRETNLELYSKCLQEWARVVESGGRAVLLTSDTKSLQKSQKSISQCWKIQKSFRFKIMGIWASCFVLNRI